MTGFDVFVFFGLPVLILAGSLIGLAILKRPARHVPEMVPDQPQRSTAVIRYKVEPLILPRAANE